MDNIFDLSNFLHFVTEFAVSAYQRSAAYLSELPQHKLTAVSLFLALIALLFVFILVWYVKTILRAIREEKRKEQEIMENIDVRLDRRIPQYDFDEDIDAETPKNPQEKIFNKEKNKKPKEIIKKNTPDFDWERHKYFDDDERIGSSDVLQYRLKPQKLETMLGLIVDLLERGVDEPKIAQTIMFKNQHLNSEDDIIQTITSIKFFVYLCLNGRFRKINSDRLLPQETTAVFHIARGDCSLALLLLETMIDNNIAKINSMREGREKDRKWSETSNCATIFGTLASFENTMLAIGAFELAIELNPRNVTAWGRIADMYNRIEQTEKAVWAYNNVLNLADEVLYTQQIANANKMLAAYYRENNRRDEAEIMSGKSRRYYDMVGINKPLTEREVKIVRIIESNEFDNMETIVDNLFNPQKAPETDGYV